MEKQESQQCAGHSRRRFLENVGMICALGSTAAELSVPGLAWGDDDSGPIDCGPPPTAKPQHQTGGESFPPAAAAGHAAAAQREEEAAQPRRP